MRLLALVSALVVLTASQAWAGNAVPPPIPEPASLGLLAIGMGGVALARFRRRR